MQPDPQPSMRLGIRAARTVTMVFVLMCLAQVEVHHCVTCHFVWVCEGPVVCVYMYNVCVRVDVLVYVCVDVCVCA